MVVSWLSYNEFSSSCASLCLRCAYASCVRHVSGWPRTRPIGVKTTVGVGVTEAEIVRVDIVILLIMFDFSVVYPGGGEFSPLCLYSNSFAFRTAVGLLTEWVGTRVGGDGSVGAGAEC